MSKTLEERFEAFAIQFANDPDFQKLPFPEHILKKLNLYKEKKYMNATDAVNYAINAPNINNYKGGITTIDLSVSESSFPNLADLANSTNTIETSTQPLKDSSSPHSSDGVVDKDLSASDHGVAE
jgi:hypothetical protein